MGLYGLAAVTVSGVALHQAVAFGRHLIYLYISIGRKTGNRAILFPIHLLFLNFQSLLPPTH